jgi:hypothetical protein
VTKKISKRSKPAPRSAKKYARISSSTSVGSTSSGPSHPAAAKNPMAAHAADQESLAAAVPANEAKASEEGY